MDMFGMSQEDFDGLEKFVNMTQEEQDKIIDEELPVEKHENMTKIEKIKNEWKEYVKYLQEKYPVEEGQEWRLTCPHHQKIDDILNEE